MNEILQINPKFEQIIPPLTTDEFAQLEENILKLGRITEPIHVWNGVIVDGHHRYKIALKYPEVTYDTFNHDFQSEHEAIAWMCSSQLGRRNLTDPHKRYLVGKRYNVEKNVGFYVGNQYTLPKESGVGRSDPPQNTHGKRSEIAALNGVSESYVKRAACFAEGVDAAEEVYPGIKKQILAEEIEVTIPELTEIAKMNPKERKEAVALLLVPKDKRDKSKEIARQIEEAFANGTEQEIEEEVPQEKEVIVPIPESAPTPKPAETEENDSETEKHEIEESILNSMIGAVNMFIDSINNYLSRFPRLRTDPKYRSQTREIMVAARDYINDVEGDLL